LIEVRNLVVEYPGGFKALDNVSIVIPKDTVTCIIGPNGAGKSTLLRSIAKMLKFQGTILIDGVEVAKKPLKVISRLVSYASQLYVHELFSLTVEEALLTARYPVSRGFIESREDYEVIRNVSKELLIDHLMKRKLSQLSSGELQRVVLAMAIVKNPLVMLFDELDAYVDIGVKSILARLIRKWARERVVVFTTHDIVFGTSIGEYIVVLNRGKVLYAGDIEGLKRNVELLERIYGVSMDVVSVNGRTLLIPRYT